MLSTALKSIISDINLPSPLETITVTDLVGSELNIYIKRDDLIHPYLSGNKLRKLASLVTSQADRKHLQLVTFGGPHSNHLHATAWLCQFLGWDMLAIMPQYISSNHNATFRDLLSMNVKVLPVDKKTMRELKKHGPESLIAELVLDPNRAVVLPMGGDTASALVGVGEIVAEVRAEKKGPVEWIIPVGTGCTAEGMIRASGENDMFWLYLPFRKERIVNELKNRFHSFIEKGVQVRFLPLPEKRYGKLDPGVRAFIEDIKNRTGVLLDPIYNGPALKSWLEFGEPPTHPVVLLHTGGLQGWRGIGN